MIARCVIWQSTDCIDLPSQAHNHATTILDRDMVWKLGKLQSAYNELRFDVETVLAVHKSFVFRLLIVKQHG